jgi:hypothetical protein
MHLRGVLCEALGIRKMTHLQITDTAILVGFTATGECVYSASIPLGEYWDGEHVWDDSAQVKKLKLEKVFGFLFGQSGNLVQHFESTFDANTGIFKNGWAKHEDGTIVES